MLTTRIIPQSQPALITLAEVALSGAETLGVTLSLAQNTATRIGLDLHALVGDPGSSTTLGAEAALAAARVALTTARATRRDAVKAGRKFCGDAVDQLKAIFGRTWNPLWEGAGFSQSSLAVAGKNPLPKLLELRNYYRANPARENTALGITAAAAEAAAEVIRNAEQSVTTAITARKTASDNRAAARKQLHARMKGLRDELEQLLGPDDARWQQFGFTRPAGRRMPAPVTGLIATPGLPGQVVLSHDPSARALDYRVSWLLNTSGAEPTVLGLFADTTTLVTGLPSGAVIILRVTARNESGETQPVEVTVTVP